MGEGRRHRDGISLGPVSDGLALGGRRRWQGTPDVSTWPLMLLIIAATMLFRWQGDSWSVTVVKLVGLTGLALAAVTILGIVIAWLG